VAARVEANPVVRPLVACLCAEWCGSCREYRTTFDTLAAQFAGAVDFAWIDVEDDADALGDVDVEDFPTLLIADAGGPRFVGAVTPQPGTAERLIRGVLAGELAVAADAGLTGRVRALLAERDDPPRDAA
jgi:thiol-disulfide isomerase/thioredoxin